jgi:DNA-binding MarR family transcriptional regulator
MGINDIIKQKAFASEAQKAIVNLAYTQSYFSGVVANALKPFNITNQQFNVLRILKGQDPEPISINEISNRMVDRMSNASRLVDKLCKKGLALRSISKHDKRQVDVSLTSQGADILSQLNVLINKVVEEHDTLCEEEFVQLNDLLDKFRRD